MLDTYIYAAEQETVALINDKDHKLLESLFTIIIFLKKCGKYSKQMI